MHVVTKQTTWDLPDDWQLVKSPKLIPIAGVINAWLVFYRKGDSLITLLVGQHSGQVVNWCYVP